MKPRVLMSTGTYRIVRKWTDYTFLVEKSDGHDALGTTRWKTLCSEDLKPICVDVLNQFGQSLVRREKAMRKARRRRGGA